MNEWAGVFLAVMALSLVIMAAIQIALIVVGIRVARQVTAVTAQLQNDVRPLVERAHEIAENAARVSSLATIQAERLDQLVATTTTRLESTVSLLQGAVSGPVGQTAAAVTAFRAAFNAFRGWQGRRRQHAQGADGDDPLFVG